MIPTLTTNSYLYKTNRHRQHFLNAIEKRRVLLFCCAITAVVTFGVIMFILRH